VIDDIEPAQEGVDQRPENAVVDAPTEKGRKNGADAAENPSATASTSSPFVSLSHNRSILVTGLLTWIEKRYFGSKVYNATLFRVFLW
jgi:hypothetical protein